MKKERIIKLVSASMALCILSSCGASSAGNISSTVTKNENQSTVSSEVSKEETSSTATTSDKDDISSKEEESSVPTPVKPPVSSKDEKPTSSKESISSDATSSEPILPYYIPKDNPAPISINGTSAANPTPISYTDKVIGKDIDFEAKRIRVSNGIDGAHIQVAVIRTYDELSAIYKLDSSDTYWSGPDYTDMYDEKYFDDKAIIMLFVTHGGLGSEYNIEQVAKENGQLCIYVKWIKYGAIDSISCTRKLISVSKSDLEDVNTLVLYRENYMVK